MSICGGIWLIPLARIQSVGIVVDMDKTNGTEAKILAAIGTAGKYVTSAGHTRARRNGPSCSYGMREAATINRMEKAGLVTVERRTVRSHLHGESDTTIIVKAAK